MQRFGRFNRPGLKGSANYSLLGGLSSAVRITPTGVLLPDDPDLTVSDYDLIQQRTSLTLEFRRSVGAGAGGFNYQYASPGSKVSFQTDSTSLDLELYWNGQLTGTGYRPVGNVLVNGVSVGTFTFTGVQPATTTHTYTLSAGTKTVTILWSVSAGLQLTKVTLAPGSTIKAAVPPSSVIAFAGDSITQGYSVTSTADSWTYGVADSLGFEQLNVAYGFAKVDPADATSAFTGKSPISYITYMIGYNDWTANTGTTTYGTRLTAWIQNVRTLQPNAKILCISPIFQSTGSGAVPLQDYRNKMLEVVQGRITAADHAIFYLDGLAAMTNNANRLADGIHPNDLGASEIETSVLNKINEAAASQPTSLTATASTGQIALSWSVAGTYTGTIIERRTPAGSGAYSYLASVPAGTTSYTDTGLGSNIQYEYRVKAYSMGGESAYSSSASATTPTVVTYSSSYVVVGSGGGGSRGGGGAGGYKSGTLTLTQGVTYSVTVAAGGATNGNSADASSGGNSVFASVTSNGGGGGGLGNGVAGASGGGGGANTFTTIGGNGTAGQGNNGGGNGGLVWPANSNAPAGGGGGAGAAGNNAPNNNNGGAGGDGIQSSITGVATYYAGGGGGACYFGGTGGAGGQGGGGAGGTNAISGVAGTANRGGGGGGSNLNPQAGGSGVVIVSVPTASYSGTTTGSPTVTTSGSNTIMQFNASGSYTA